MNDQVSDENLAYGLEYFAPREGFGPRAPSALYEIAYQALRELQRLRSSGGAETKHAERCELELLKGDPMAQCTCWKGLTRQELEDSLDELSAEVERLRSAAEPSGTLPEITHDIHMDFGGAVALIDGNPPQWTDIATELAKLARSTPHEPSEIQRLRGQLEAADHAADACMKERDDAEEQADKLAECIAGLLDIDIGEHSSGNAPWQNAIDAAEYELDKRKRRALEPAGEDRYKVPRCPRCNRLARASLMGMLSCTGCGNTFAPPPPETKVGEHGR